MRNETKDSRVVRGDEAVPGEGAIAYSARFRNRFVFGHLVRHVESVHVEQIVQHPHVVALEPIELEFDHQEWPESSETSVLEDVTLGNFFHQGRSEIRGLGLVICVLGEAKPLIDVELRQVDDDRAVR